MNRSGFPAFFVIYSTMLHSRTQTQPEYFMETLLRVSAPQVSRFTFDDRLDRRDRRECIRVARKKRSLAELSLPVKTLRRNVDWARGRTNHANFIFSCVCPFLSRSPRSTTNVNSIDLISSGRRRMYIHIYLLLQLSRYTITHVILSCSSITQCLPRILLFSAVHRCPFFYGTHTGKSGTPRTVLTRENAINSHSRVRHSRRNIHSRKVRF